MKIIGVCWLAISAFVSVSHASVIHLVNDDGILTGANNVLVDGTLYDVEFRDGTCIELFNGCDDVSDFVFDTFAAASVASRALFGQVFVDGAYGLFDSDPALTQGCDYHIYCLVGTYYGITEGTNDVNTAQASNSKYADSKYAEADLVSDVIRGKMWDYKFAFADKHSVSVWSLSTNDDPSEVSAPGTAIVLLMGLAGLMVCRTRTQSICHQS